MTANDTRQSAAQRETDGNAAETSGRTRRSGAVRMVVSLLPLVFFAALAATFYMQLTSGRDASEIPSVLIGKPAPPLDLPPLADLNDNGDPVPGLKSAMLSGGKPTLLNVWASWCVPCRQEQPILMRLADDDRFELVGINYKDEPDNARQFLRNLGNPFSAVGADRSGRAGIDWGVYGVPETYLVSADGTVVYKHVGPFTEETLNDDLLPAIEKALASDG